MFCSLSSVSQSQFLLSIFLVVLRSVAVCALLLIYIAAHYADAADKPVVGTSCLLIDGWWTSLVLPIVLRQCCSCYCACVALLACYPRRFPTIEVTSRLPSSSASTMWLRESARIVANVRGPGLSGARPLPRRRLGANPRGSGLQHGNGRFPGTCRCRALAA